MILRWFVDLEILEWTDRLKRTFFHQINTNISLGEGTKTKRITYEIEKGTTIAKRRTFTRKVRNHTKRMQNDWLHFILWPKSDPQP